MRKRNILFFAFLLLGIIFLINSVSALYCCEKTIDSNPTASGNQPAFCQQVEEVNLCDPALGKAPTSCDQTDYCKTGTCVDISAGTCSPARKAACREPARWIDADAETLNECKEGCCIMGDRVNWGTKTQCDQIGYKDGIKTQFRADLDIGECFALDLSQTKGACTREVNFVTECTVVTKDACRAISGSTFHRGLLCSAPGLSDCVMPENPETRCDNGKVYFLDSCKNLANIYDVDKAGSIPYWTNIQEPTCTVTGKSSTCGNCDYRIGTTCGEYKSGIGNLYQMPSSAPAYGNNVCRDMSCKYKGEIFSHGESWCNGTAGTFAHIPEVINETARTTTDIESSAYNVPGSEYYRLQCWDGEVLNYTCAPARQEICSESYIAVSGSGDVNGDGKFLTGTCRANNWRECTGINNSADCENPIRDCKWLHGYRFDKTLIKDFLGNPGDIPEDTQGSCVPLFAPGYEFWKENNQGLALCVAGTTAEIAYYETPLLLDRDVFADSSTLDASHRCLENCYSIPQYGSGITLQQAMDFYNGIDTLGGNNNQYYLSLRKGQYCTPYSLGDHIERTPSEGRAIGPLSPGMPPHCATDELRIIKPLFYTNEQWLNFLKNRTAALGDCGYKVGSSGQAGQPTGEIITAIFEKLNQKGEVIGEKGTVETIYTGDTYTFEDYRRS